MSLLSWATFGESGGVALSNLGVSGTQLRDFAARDDAVLTAEFEAYKPDLIILAYGTNEGYVPTVDTAAYEALLKDQLRRLKRLTHGVPVLVLGAPDAETLRPDLYGTGGTFPQCAALSDEEQRDFASLIAQHAPRLARWYPPAGPGAHPRRPAPGGPGRRRGLLGLGRSHGRRLQRSPHEPVRPQARARRPHPLHRLGRGAASPACCSPT